MQRKKIFSLVLAFALVFGLMSPMGLMVEPASAATVGEFTVPAQDSNYFYEQLTPRAQMIYDALLEMHQDGRLATGTADYDLTENGKVTSAEVQKYKEGDRQLFNDFVAAKDAFDLDHSEVWYFDSSYISFRPGYGEDGQYHAVIGIGRDTNYFLAGDDSIADEVAQMDADVKAAVDKIVENGRKARQKAIESQYSEQDQVAAVVRSVHNDVVNSLSYRFEDEAKPENVKYIRTLYALVTHEGVCEAYARAMQVCLTLLGVECILVHGVQASGTPEDHMWNAVNIPDTDQKDRWFVVDATWDDPLTADWFGKRELIDVEKSNGLDGKENNTYMLVGQTIVGKSWLPSGNVSVGGEFEFKYPTINGSSYDGSTVYGGEEGLEVKYSAGAGSMEDNLPAGVFTVKFQGMNAAQAREKGFYFLIKMYQVHKDGTKSEFQDWYYVDAALAFLQGTNEYFGDTEDGLRIYTGHCEYVELAVTTNRPVGLETWNDSPWSGTNQLLANPDLGYFNGSPADIIGQSGLLINTESGYEAPPYVHTQYPGGNYRVTAGTTYDAEVIWDDILYHPSNAQDEGPVAAAQAKAMAISNPMDTATSEDMREEASQKTVQLRYEVYTPDADFEDLIPWVTHKTMKYDANNDKIVDAEVLEWIFDKEYCPHKGEPGHQHDPNLGCPITGVRFKFDPSDMWADDYNVYHFYIDGVVGSRSWKTPNLFEIVTVCPSLCPYCYRSQGIDWNLWGRPMLLDNPDDLNLSEITMKGVDGVEESLADLQNSMKIDRMNGRLMLVAENIGEGGNDKMKYKEVTGALENQLGIQEENLLTSLMYEINFTKLCAKTIANTGDSMRIQIGYPEGFDYSKYLDNEVTFKAYHFTRNDEGKIISVEEVPITFTAYGMVLLVSSFSPFEIVALDPQNLPKSVTATPPTNERTIVAAFGEGGALYLEDGETKTVGTNGMISLKPGESMTFFCEPEEGYAIEGVSFDGHDIEVNPLDNTVTITYDDITNGTCIINATFVPEAVIEADEALGIEPVIADTAVENSTPVPARLQKSLTVGAEDCDYTSIQDAIDAIDNGTEFVEGEHGTAEGKQNWTITVADGEYDRFVVLPGMDGTIIRGAHSANVVIRTMDYNSNCGNHSLDQEKLVDSSARSDGKGVIIDAKNVTLDNLTFTTGDAMGAAFGHFITSSVQIGGGFQASSSNYKEADSAVIKNCTFTNNQNDGKDRKAIVLYGPIDTYEVENCTFTGYSYAIWHEDNEGAPVDITIKGNTFNTCDHAYYNLFKHTDTSKGPQGSDGSLVITGNTFNGTEEKPIVLAIFDMSEKNDLATLTISDNIMKNADVIQHGLNTHPEITNVLENNTSDDLSIYIGVDDAADGKYNATLHAPAVYRGMWELNPDATNKVKVWEGGVNGEYKEVEHNILWTASQYSTLPEYVQSVIDAANESKTRELVLEGLSISEESSRPLSDIGEWLHHNLTYIDGCKKNHNYKDGFCQNCGDKDPDYMAKNKKVDVGENVEFGFQTIQEAIDYIQTVNGDKSNWTINVQDGTYEGFTIPSELVGLTVKAVNKGETHIQAAPAAMTMALEAAPAEAMVTVSGNSSTINGLSFNGAAAAIAITEGPSYYSVVNCTFEDCQSAIVAISEESAPSNGAFRSNTFRDCADAIYVEYAGPFAGTLTISGNNISGTNRSRVAVFNMSHGDAIKVDINSNTMDNTVVLLANVNNLESLDEAQNQMTNSIVLPAETTSRSSAATLTIAIEAEEKLPNGKWIVAEIAEGPLNYPWEQVDALKALIQAQVEEANEANSTSVVIPGIATAYADEVYEYLQKTLSYIDATATHHIVLKSTPAAALRVKGDAEWAVAGMPIEIIVTPADGYVLEGIALNDLEGRPLEIEITDVGPTEDGIGHIYRFVLGEQDVEVSAKVKEIHAVVAGMSENGSLVFEPESAAAGTRITVTVTAEEGYQLSEIVANTKTGKPVVLNQTSDNTYTFEMPDEEVKVTAAFEALAAHTYTITVNQPVHGSAHADQDYAVAGDTVVITVEPEEKYAVASVHAAGVSGDVEVTPNGGNQYSFRMPEEDVTVTVTMRKTVVPHKVTIESSSRGIVDVFGMTYEQGDTITVTPKASDGYEVAAVQVFGTSEVAVRRHENGSYTFTMPNFDVTVKVTYSARIYNVYTSKLANGSIEVSRKTASIGDEVTINVTLPEYHSVAAVSVLTNGNGKVEVENVSETEYKFIMPSSDVTVMVTLIDNTPKAHSITVHFGTNGVATSDHESAKSGDPIAVTVLPNPGYAIDTVLIKTVSGTVISANVIGNTYNFTMPDDDVIINATFVEVIEPTYGIEKTTDRHGAICPDKVNAKAGELITLSIAPDEGYEVESVSVKDSAGRDIDVTRIDATHYSFIMPDRPVTVSAVYVESTYTITVLDSLHGTVSANVSKATAGTRVEITVAPGTGYELQSVVVTDEHSMSVPVSGYGNHYTFVMPTDNVTVTAMFSVQTISEPTVYNVTVAAAQHGSVSVSTNTATEGSLVQFKLTPDYGYELDSVVVVSKGQNLQLTQVDNATYRFTMPAADVTISAIFRAIVVEEPTYRISVETPINGSVDIFTLEKITEGSPVTVVAYPNVGYLVDTVTVRSMSGKLISTERIGGTRFSFDMPAEDVLVTVTFKLIPSASYGVSIQPSQNGTVMANKNSALAGDIVTLTIVPAKGYHLSSVTVTDSNGHNVPITNNSFVMPAANVTVSAIFESDQLPKDPEKAYNVKVTNTPHAIVTVDKQTAKANEIVTIKVDLNSGWLLDSITVRNGDSTIGTNVLNDTTFTFAMPAGDVVITVGTKQITSEPQPEGYAITVDRSIVRGQIELSTQRAVAGDMVILTVSPEYHYELASLTLRDSAGFEIGLIVIAENKYCFVMPASDVNISATFVEVEESSEYKISTRDSLGGYIWTSSRANAGDEVAINIIPYEDYEIDSVVVYDSKGSKVAVQQVGDYEFRFEMPASDVTVYAMFEYAEIEEHDYKIKVEINSNHGDIYIDSSADYGDEVEFELDVDSGYYIDSMTITRADGRAVKYELEDDYTGSFTMPRGDVIIEVEIVKESSKTAHKITLHDSEHGTISNNDIKPKEEGSTVTVYINPDKGYELNQILVMDDDGNVLVKGDAPTKEGIFTFKMPDCNVSVYATFRNQFMFTDVATDAWYYQAVKEMATTGMMVGISDTEFGPNQSITRAEVVMILYKLSGSPTVYGKCTYTDVPEDAWYNAALRWAQDNMVVAGRGDGTFDPNGTVTREQLVTMVANYHKFKGTFTGYVAIDGIKYYRDFNKISGWALPYMAWAWQMQIIKGTDDLMLKPDVLATRAETAAMINNLRTGN